MQNQSEQLNSPSRLKRFVSNPWGRVFIGVVLIALIGVLAYMGFGLVSGGPARLTFTSQLYNYTAGDTITVSVLLDSADQPVTVVGSYIQYDPTWLTPDLAGTTAGDGWTNPTPTLIKNPPVTVSATLSELEVVVGQPSPGIVSNNTSQKVVALIPFKVSANPPFPQGQTAGQISISFNTQKTVVIKDDAGGSDILGSVGQSPIFTVFPAPAGASECFSAHPTADMCRSDEYCPAPYPENPACCQIQCVPSPANLIDESSIYAEVVKNASGGIDRVVIHWNTRSLTSYNLVEYGSTRKVYRSRVVDTTPTNSHAVQIGGVSAGFTYYFRVGSSLLAPTDPTCGTVPANCALTSSGEHSFSTATGQASALQVLDVSASAISNTSALVTWTTNYPADSTVACVQTFGPGTCFSNAASSGLSTIHSVRISGLTPGTTYAFMATSRLASGSVPSITDPNLRVARGSGSVTTTNLSIQSDANVILKTEPDRVCDSWLSCSSYLEVKNRAGKIENMCFALAECDALDPITGACLNLRPGSSAAQFSATSGGGGAVDLVKNLSGNVEAGLEVSGFGGQFPDASIRGAGSFGTVIERGSSVTVPNSSFEVGLDFYPWEQYPAAGSSIGIQFDLAAGGNVLKVAPAASTATTWGVRVPLGKGVAQAGSGYYLAFHIQASLAVNSPTLPPPAQMIAELGTQSQVSAISFPVGAGWQQVVLGPFTPPAGNVGEVYLGISSNGGANQPSSFSIDDININPVLGAGFGLIPRVCRGYPTSSSPACDYFDPFTGRSFRGWKGYCLVPDPKDNAGKESTRDCLQWWPVDVISGSSSVFSLSQGAGYLSQGGRFPLYYCLEAEGNHPYWRKFTADFENNDPCTRKLSQSAAGYGDAKDAQCAVGEMSTAESSVFQGVLEDSIAYIDMQIAYDPQEGDNPRVDLRLTKQNNWSAAAAAGGTCPADILTWRGLSDYITRQVDQDPNNTKHPGGNCDAVGVKVNFNALGYFDSLDYGYFDDSPQGGAMRFSIITLGAREACSVITQTVDPFGKSVSLSDRLTSSSYKIPGLLYPLGTDYQPFGAIVHPDPDYAPEGIAGKPETRWGKLFIEPPSDEMFSETPYQVRGGTPYGVREPISVTNNRSFCKSNPNIRCDLTVPDPDAPCRQSPALPNSCEQTVSCGTICVSWFACSMTGALCDSQNPCPPLQSSDQICIDNSLFAGTFGQSSTQGVGPKMCILGSQVGQVCATSAECGTGEDGSSGHCTGFDRPSGIGDYQVFQTLLEGNPALGLANIFAKTYGTWEWISGTYQKICGENGVPLCVGGTNSGIDCSASQGQSNCSGGGGRCGYQTYQCVSGGLACRTDNDCAVGSCELVALNSCSDIRVLKDYGWDATKSVAQAQKFGIQPPRAPVVSNIMMNEQPASNGGTFTGSAVSLSFNSHVDGNQLPLVRYSVDWGDGEVTTESDLSIAPKSSPKDPHRLGHVYRAGGSHTIRIQIEDNWGWCNGNTTVASCGF